MHLLDALQYLSYWLHFYWNVMNRIELLKFKVEINTTGKPNNFLKSKNNIDAALISSQSKLLF